MYELIQLSEHDFYIDCPAKMGLVQVSDSEFIAIDSGNDKDAGKKLLRILEANHWQLHAVFNTHSHADHIGGNKFLQDRTGCLLYAPGLECSFSNAPQLEPMGLYGGLPFQELKNKFLMAQASNVLPLTPEILPAGMQIIPLPGHSFDMVGFLTADGNAFLADCVSSAETLNKYGIGYLWDPVASVDTLERVKQLEAQQFIPAHAPVTDNIVPLADLNIAAIRRTEKLILSFCQQPLTFEELLKKIFEAYGLTMTVQQYVLIGSTIRSYLSSLKTQGKLTYCFDYNRMLWKTEC